MLIGRARSQLLIIDVQQKLAPHVADQQRIIDNCRRLAIAAVQLGVPITFSEHYPAGLGPTVEAIKRQSGNGAQAIGKVEFSCWRNASLKARIEELRRAGRKEVVVCGMEAHVCVCQSVIDLVANGFEVFLVADAVGSRLVETKELAIERMRRAGAGIVAQEMVIFEWLERADTKEFNDLLALIK